MGADEAQVQAIPLTKQALELRRLRDAHLELIASIPETPGPTAALTALERQEVVVAKIFAHPDGIPVPPRVGENWFNPNLGLTF